MSEFSLFAVIAAISNRSKEKSSSADKASLNSPAIMEKRELGLCGIFVMVKVKEWKVDHAHG
jgi:hypothetical protein